MIKYKLFFILFMSYFTGIISKSSNEFRMIADVIRDSDKITSVVAHLCWKPSKQIQLVSHLGNTEMKKTVMFVNKYWPNIKEPQHRERLLVIADVGCPTTEYFLKLANATKKLGFPYRWLIIGKAVNESICVTTDFNDLHLLPDADVIIAQENHEESYVLNMIYKINAQSTWIIEPFGNWTASNGLSKSKLAMSSISDRRKNFRREIIKTGMVILDNRTISNLYDLSDILTDIVTKSSYRQIVPLYGYLNASHTLIYSETWGYYRNGSYGGMIAELTIGDAELGGTVLINTWDRMQVVDYLASPIPISIKFVFREPPLSYQNNLFLLPFKTTVWYCMGAFVLMLGFILYITALWENKKIGGSELNSKDPTALKPNVSDIAILVISAISQQGSTIELKGTLGRIVMFILFLAFLLLYSSYSASIVALLQSSSSQIRTLTDLLNSKLELGVEDTPYNRYFFPIATEPVRKAIYQTKIAPRGTEPKFMSLEEGVKKLQKEPFAFNMNKGIGYRLVERYFHEHEKCGLQEIAYLYTTKTYITCRKNSPYKEIFKIGLFMIKEHGLSNRENRLIYARKPACRARDGNFDSVDMVDFHPVPLMNLRHLFYYRLFRIKEHGLSDRENRLIYGRKPACRARGGNFDSVNMVDFHPVLLMYLYGILLAFALLAIEIFMHRKNLLRCKDKPEAEVSPNRYS